MSIVIEYLFCVAYCICSFLLNLRAEKIARKRLEIVHSKIILLTIGILLVNFIWAWIYSVLVDSISVSITGEPFTEIIDIYAVAVISTLVNSLMMTAIFIKAYEYDANGNLVYVNTGRTKKDGTTDEKANERKLKWDEENRLLASDDDGFVTNYWYDADGERTVKTSGESEQVYVNSEFAGGRTNTAKFSLYVSPYLVANQGGRYTKHIYIGSQRIVSKIGDFASYGSDPRRIQYAGSEADAISVDYAGKYLAQQEAIKENYATFDVPYNGTDNNDYVNGEGFCCDDGSMEAAQTRALAKALEDNFQEGDAYENLQFYYHPDHLGSSSYITNLNGEVVQHIEYVPFGEVFIEERNNIWNTPYLFNAKEFDEETGLYYYGARYYDPRLSLWMSVDPLAENYPNVSIYCYTINNPIKFIDPDGKKIVGTTKNDIRKFVNDINSVLFDEKFAEFRTLIKIKGKTLNKIDESFLATALNGLSLSIDEKTYIDMITNTINSSDTYMVEYLNYSDVISDKGKNAIRDYLNSVQEGFGDAMITPDGTMKASVISALGGEGLNVPTDNGSHSFIIDVPNSKTKRCVTSGHEVFGHGIPSARKESIINNNNNAIRTDNLIRRIIGMPQRDGKDHAGGEQITKPQDLPYTH